MGFDLYHVQKAHDVIEQSIIELFRLIGGLLTGGKTKCLSWN